MDTATYVGIIGYSIRFCFTAMALVFLWWRKEYRMDRMLIHLKTKQGKYIIFGRVHLMLGLLLVLWTIPQISGYVYMLIAGLFMLLGFSHARSFSLWFKPPVSPKVLTLLFILFVTIVMVAILSNLPMLIVFAIGDLLLFPVSVVAVLVMSLPTRVYHYMKIQRAIQKLETHQKMMVIGVTGSYGKTSIKEYISTILSSVYPTLKTEASKNSPIGIAEVLLRSLKDSHKSFIVEMGAYRPGEIFEMAKMVKPEIGVLTAINPQHQDLFGSIETTMDAKYELLKNLTGKKIAVVNIDDERVVTLAKRALDDGCKVWGWTRRESFVVPPFVSKTNVFHATNISSDLSGVSFDCSYRNEKVRIYASVLGEHQSGNITASIAAAVAAGVPFRTAAMIASSVKPAKKVMEVIPGVHGAIFVDDTFNNNPDAAAAAIQFLGSQKGGKILVFQPMVELGAYAKVSHETVGKIAAKNCDAILLTNASYYEAFEKGVRSISKSVPLHVYAPIQVSEYIRSHVKKDDVVLFKGKDAEHALHLLV